MVSNLFDSDCSCNPSHCLQVIWMDIMKAAVQSEPAVLQSYTPTPVYESPAHTCLLLYESLAHSCLLLFESPAHT
jgi:hypothetical protein